MGRRAGQAHGVARLGRGLFGADTELGGAGPDRRGEAGARAAWRGSSIPRCQSTVKPADSSSPAGFTPRTLTLSKKKPLNLQSFNIR